MKLRIFLSAALLALGLAGCTQVQQTAQQIATFTAADVSAAEAVAVAAGDTQGAACYAALEPIVANAPAGIVSGFELLRAGQLIANNQCAAILANLSVLLLQQGASALVLGQTATVLGAIALPK